MNTEDENLQDKLPVDITPQTKHRNLTKQEVGKLSSKEKADYFASLMIEALNNQGKTSTKVDDN